MNNDLTVIIVNRNTAGLLVRCIAAVYASDLATVPQVIVVDNGSRDDSVARVKTEFPAVELIEAGRNLGFAAANNRALGLATGDYLLLVNTDAFLAPDCARLLMELAQSDPDIGMVGPLLLNRDGSLQTSFEAPPDLYTEILNRSLLKRMFPAKYPRRFRAEHPIEVPALIGAVMLIRASAMRKLGGFDERYFFFLEETDLTLRMREAGFKIMHHPHATAIHEHGATAKTHAGAARIEFYRSRYLFFEKQYGRRKARILRAALTANLLMRLTGLGMLHTVTGGLFRGIGESYRVTAELWKWHARGLPPEFGLPRD